MHSAHSVAAPDSDPVIEFYKQKVDRAALRANLKLTVDQRLAKLQRMVREKEICEGRAKQQIEPQPAPPRWDAVSDCGPDRTTDPIIELYKRDVDRTLLRENLKLTPEQRLLKLRDFMQFVGEMRRAGERARERA